MDIAVEFIKPLSDFGPGELLLDECPASLTHFAPEFIIVEKLIDCRCNLRAVATTDE